MSFIERTFLSCVPLFGVSFIEGSTVFGTHTAYCRRVFQPNLYFVNSVCACVEMEGRYSHTNLMVAENGHCPVGSIVREDH